MGHTVSIDKKKEAKVEDSSSVKASPIKKEPNSHTGTPIKVNDDLVRGFEDDLPLGSEKENSSGGGFVFMKSSAVLNSKKITSKDQCDNRA